MATIHGGPEQLRHAAPSMLRAKKTTKNSPSMSALRSITGRLPKKDDEKKVQARKGKKSTPVAMRVPSRFQLPSKSPRLMSVESDPSWTHVLRKDAFRAKKIANSARMRSGRLMALLGRIRQRPSGNITDRGRAASTAPSIAPSLHHDSDGDRESNWTVDSARASPRTSAARRGVRQHRSARGGKGVRGKTDTTGSTHRVNSRVRTPLERSLTNTEHHIRTKSFSRLETIGDEHSEFELTWCMLNGLQYFVEGMSMRREKLLAQRHFKQTRTHRFVTTGQERRFGRTFSRMGHYSFKDYAPRVFQEIRRLSGIAHRDYIESVCHNNYIEFISNSKSGAFFFFSNDGQYMIKTIEGAEAKCLMTILQKYYLYLKSNPESLLARFYGLHRVTLQRPIGGRRKFHFIVMQSVFYTDKYIHAIFDLKGSEVGRTASDKDQTRVPSDKMTGTVLKDNDLKASDVKIRVGTARAAELLAQLRKDAKFLAEAKIIDYSLLVGIHYPDMPDPRESREAAGSTSILDTSKPNFRLPEPVDPSLDALHLRAQTRATTTGAKTKELAPAPPRLTRHKRINTWSTSTSRLHGEAKRPGVAAFGLDMNADSTGGAVASAGSYSERPKRFSRSFSAFGADVRPRFDGIKGATEKHEVYYLGIIDILIQFSLFKRGEYIFKGYIQGHGKKASVIPPPHYAQRFIDFCNGIIA